MVTRMSQLVQSTRAAITFTLVLGTLSMVWPAIIALNLGAFLLFHSWISGEAVVTLLAQVR
jgi:hypothetical protein